MKTIKTLTLLPLGLLVVTLTTQQLYANDSQTSTRSLGSIPPKTEKFLTTPNASIIVQDVVQNVVQDPRISALAPLAVYGANQLLKNAAMGSRAGSSFITSLARQVDGYKWWLLGGTAAAGAYVLITRKNKAINEEKKHVTVVNEAVLEFQSALEAFPKNPTQVTAADIDHLLGVLAYSNAVADPYLIPHTRQLANTHYELAEKTIAQLEKLRDEGLQELQYREHEILNETNPETDTTAKKPLVRQLAHSKLAQTLFGHKLGIKTTNL